MQCVHYSASLAGVKEGRLLPLMTGDGEFGPIGTPCLSAKLLWAGGGVAECFVPHLSSGCLLGRAQHFPWWRTGYAACPLWALFSARRHLCWGFWDGAGTAPALGAQGLEAAGEAQTLHSTMG